LKHIEYSSKKAKADRWCND